MDRIRTTAFIFLGLSLMPLGILIVRSGAVARWMGWLGLVGGVLVFVGLLAQIFKVIGGIPASIVSMTALLCAFGFIIILGIRLMMRETREATAGLSSRKATTFS